MRLGIRDVNLFNEQVSLGAIGAQRAKKVSVLRIEGNNSSIAIDSQHIIGFI